MESLTGYFLIATHQMPDPRFAGRVIYICRHDPSEGAMGFIVNQPLADVTLAELYASMDLEVPDFELPNIFVGGPVDVQGIFFLHSSDYETPQYLEVTDSINLSRSSAILEDIAIQKGPRDYRCFIGYSGWAPGQLEEEMRHEGWLILPAEYNDLFKISPERMWKQITARHGIDISNFSEHTGFA